jgi:hypothetical protein
MIDRRLTGTLCSIVALAACGDRPASRQAEAANWRPAEVIVTDRSPAEPRRLMMWVRVVNQSATLRAICTRSIGYAVSHADYQNVGTSGEVRPCTDAAAFAIVAPGESSYVPTPIAAEDLDLDDAELTVKLMFTDAPVPHLRPATEATLEWRMAVGAIASSP